MVLWILGIEHILEVLTQLYPLPHEQYNIPAGRPPPRVSLSNLASGTSLDPYPLDEDKIFHTASVKCSRRITAEDWFQDVRHFEFSFKDGIKYDPGDVAVIYPSAAASSRLFPRHHGLGKCCTAAGIYRGIWTVGIPNAGTLVHPLGAQLPQAAAASKSAAHHPLPSALLTDP